MKDLAKTVLDKAADEIERRGWTVGEYEDEDGSVCLLAAMELAYVGMIGGDTQTRRKSLDWLYTQEDAIPKFIKHLDAAKDLLKPYIKRDPKDHGMWIEAYNDKAAKSKEEVVEVLRKAAQ